MLNGKIASFNGVRAGILLVGLSMVVFDRKWLDPELIGASDRKGAE
jgi:hypothetical protein